MIYGIRMGSFPIVKIGTAARVETRLRELQTSNPFPLSVLWTRDGTFDHEHKYHEHFKDRRMEGEWFNFSDIDLHELPTLLDDTWSVAGCDRVPVGGWAEEGRRRRLVREERDRRVQKRISKGGRPLCILCHSAPARVGLLHCYRCDKVLV